MNHRHADLLAGTCFLILVLVELAFMGLLAYWFLRLLAALGSA